MKQGLHFEGGRFDVGLPLKFDIGGIDRAVKSIAEELYKRDTGKKCPKLDGFELILGVFEHGSVIAEIIRYPHEGVELDAALNPYIDLAIETLAREIQNPNVEDEKIRKIILKNRPKMFSMLEGGESVSMISNDREYRVHESYYGYNLKPSIEQIHEQDITVYATVYSINIDKKTCGLRFSINGKTKNSNSSYKGLTDESLLFEAIMKRRYMKLKISGSALFKGDSFSRFKEILDIESIDPYDVGMQFDGLYNLKDGWAGVDGGSAYDRKELIVFEHLVQEIVDKVSERPSIYPMTNGDVSIDWEEPDVSLSLCLNDQKALLSNYRKMQEHRFDLNDSDVIESLKRSLLEALDG